MTNTRPAEVELAIQTLDAHKAEEIEVMEVSDFTPFATHYVLATAPNPRALGALKDYLEEEFLKAGFEVPVSEGEPESGWVIIQGGDVICHIFLAANRREIALEELVARLSAKKA